MLTAWDGVGYNGIDKKGEEYLCMEVLGYVERAGIGRISIIDIIISDLLSISFLILSCSFTHSTNYLP